MRLKHYVCACAIALLMVPLAGAQDFGIMTSAETINRGSFKLAAYPMYVLPDEGENDTRVRVGLGYGFTDSFDVEGRVAFSDDIVFLGGDVAYWVLKNLPLDLSVRGGFHLGVVNGDIGDSRGADVSVIGSAPVASKLELVGALDLAYNFVSLTPETLLDLSIRDELIALGLDVDPNDDTFTTFHLVPGIKVAVSPDLDFLAEVGIGVNDKSNHYVALGIAYYIR